MPYWLPMRQCSELARELLIPPPVTAVNEGRASRMAAAPRTDWTQRIDRQRSVAAKRCDLNRLGKGTGDALEHCRSFSGELAETWPAIAFGLWRRLPPSDDGEHQQRSVVLPNVGAEPRAPGWCLAREADDKNHRFAGQVPCRCESARAKG